jgi:voltage-gated potassium channel
MKPHITTRDNFIWLLLALVFLLLSDAVFSQFHLNHAQRLVNITLLVTMVVAVWSVDRVEGRWLRWKIGMSLAMVILMIGDIIIESNVLAIYQLLSIFVFLCFTFYLCWQQVMFSGMVDQNKIIGAICIYILMGLIWAFLYLIVEYIFPGSYTGLGQAGIWQDKFEDLTYFSLVTLTTLGYGDITPVQPLSRILALMEAITGVFYTTILVASLIGMRLAHYSGRSSDDNDAAQDKVGD